MSDKEILLVEAVSSDRDIAFALYDTLRSKQGSFVSIELKMVGDTVKIYAVTDCVSELQPGPRMSYDAKMREVQGIVVGFKAGWAAYEKLDKGR